MSVSLFSLKRSGFARDVAILSSGTAIAQAIPIAASPILTRLYAPEDFGLVAVFMSCVAMLSVVATGRYELAVTLPASDVDAADIVVLTLKICAAVSLLALAPILAFGDAIAGLLGNRAVAPWLYLVPVSVMATGAFHVFQYWCNRTSQYRHMSVNRVQNAAFTSGLNVAFGFGGVQGGQVLGGVLGQSLSAAWIALRVRRESRSTFAKATPQGQRAMARRYASHPMHVAPSQLIGTAALQIPIFLVSSVFSLATAGFFSLAYRLVSLPTLLVAGAVGDVYRQKIAVAYNEKGMFREEFLKTLKTTVLLASVPFGALYLAAPFLFAFVFGEAWRVAGEYAQILVVASYFQFIFTPLDKGALVVGATRYIFGWHAARFCLLALLLAWAQHHEMRIQTALWFFVAINSALYLADGWIGYVFSGRKSA